MKLSWYRVELDCRGGVVSVRKSPAGRDSRLVFFVESRSEAGAGLAAQRRFRKPRRAVA